MFYCKIADFLLSQISSDSIELIQDQIGKDEFLDDKYRSEVVENMQYARWFRPFIVLTLFITIFSVITLLESTLSNILGNIEEGILIKTLMTQTSRALAVVIVSLLLTFGLSFFVMGIAWSEPICNLKCYASLLMGLIYLTGGVYLIV